MSLSCSCNWELDPEPGLWVYWFENAEYLKPLDTTKRKRCCSCGELINIGAFCSTYPRYRYPHNEVEARIHGDIYFEMNDEPQIPMADHHHCEKCSEIFLNLSDIGYECILPSEDMNKLLKDYHELSGFQQKKEST